MANWNIKPFMTQHNNILNMVTPKEIKCVERKVSPHAYVEEYLFELTVQKVIVVPDSVRQTMKDQEYIDYIASLGVNIWRQLQASVYGKDIEPEDIEIECSL